MAGVREARPLQKIVAAFEPVAEAARRGGAAVELGSFSQACAQFSVLFRLLNIRFVEYAETDYLSKVNDLIEASKSISTLEDMIELDIQQRCVTKEGSHTRNLLRVKRVLDVFRVLFQEITNSSDGNSLEAAALTAYNKVFASHHDDGIRQATRVVICLLPSMSEILISLSGDEGSAKDDMQSFIRTSGPVIQYVEELFNSRQLGIDW